MKRRVFERELKRLQRELVLLQEYIKAKGLKVVVVFEGRDAAGKGGVIKRITERTSPRAWRIAALGGGGAGGDAEHRSLLVPGASSLRAARCAGRRTTRAQQEHVEGLTAGAI